MTIYSQSQQADDGDETECIYCGSTRVRAVREGQQPPEASDTAAWRRLAAEHQDGCEWIETRAHKVYPAQPIEVQP